jgi:hypothetical protein
MMALWVRDGGFGNVIGSPSSQAPTAFGNILNFRLPYTGFSGFISYVQFLRPDANADPAILQPDIVVDPAEALEFALEYLQNMGE